MCLYGHTAALGHNRYANRHKRVGLGCIRHVDMCLRYLCPDLASQGRGGTQVCLPSHVPVLGHQRALFQSHMVLLGHGRAQTSNACITTWRP